MGLVTLLSPCGRTAPSRPGGQGPSAPGRGGGAALFQPAKIVSKLGNFFFSFNFISFLERLFAQRAEEERAEKNPVEPFWAESEQPEPTLNHHQSERNRVDRSACFLSASLKDNCLDLFF